MRSSSPNLLQLEPGPLLSSSPNLLLLEPGPCTSASPFHCGAVRVRGWLLALFLRSALACAACACWPVRGGPSPGPSLRSAPAPRHVWPYAGVPPCAARGLCAFACSPALVQFVAGLWQACASSLAPRARAAAVRRARALSRAARLCSLACGFWPAHGGPMPGPEPLISSSPDLCKARVPAHFDADPCQVRVRTIVRLKAEPFPSSSPAHLTACAWALLQLVSEPLGCS